MKLYEMPWRRERSYESVGFTNCECRPDGRTLPYYEQEP
jgi:hypothetical protein